MNILTVSNLSKTDKIDKNKPFKVLEDISFELEEGSFTTIIGPSGSGKSTLLRIIAGLDKPTEGTITWSDSLPKISFVFQSFALFPFLTVEQNIEFGLKMRNIPPETRRKKIKELIDEVGLTGSETKHPKELSGGMKQRVGIARALAIDPDIILLDEPFSALDEFTAEKLRQLFLDIWQSRKMTVLMVTHLVREAIELSDNIIILTKLPGSVKKIVKNDLKRPRNERSESFYKMEDQLKGLIEV